jgi:hypothetical protein
LGGGSSSFSIEVRPSRSAFLRVSTSLLSSTFSFLDAPSSARMTSIRRSRSAMWDSRVEMYSDVIAG